jgi:hypothetical protein
MRRAWTDEETETLRKLVDAQNTAREIAETLGRPVGSVTNKMVRMGISSKDTESETNIESVKFSQTDKTATLVTVDRQIKTPEDAIKYADVDEKVWQIDRFVVNKWEQGSKDKEQEVQVVELWQVKVWFRRKVGIFEKRSLDYLESVINKSRWKPPKKVSKRTTGDHMLEVSLFDAHFGKLCWEQETGTDYDTDIASGYYLNAVDDLLADNADANIEKIIFPLGNDFFNVDSLRNETTSGTAQDVDDRYHRVYAKGYEATIAAVERCRKIAPVEIILVQGNHDTLSSYHLAFAMQCTYSDTKDVEVDCSPKFRKYRKYGKTLLGLTHGDGERPSDRTTLMAREASQWWHDCDFYEWHTGHFHAEKKLQQAGTETNGIVERVLPSLSGTDRWHAKKGYTLNRQAAMAFLYDKDKGMRRTSYAYAR